MQTINFIQVGIASPNSVLDEGGGLWEGLEVLGMSGALFIPFCLIYTVLEQIMQEVILLLH